MTTLPFHLPKPKHLHCILPSAWSRLEIPFLQPSDYAYNLTTCHHLVCFHPGSTVIICCLDYSNSLLTSPPLLISALLQPVLNMETGKSLQTQVTVYYFSTQNLPVFSVSLKSKGQSPSLTCQDPLTSLTSSPTAPLPSPSHSSYTDSQTYQARSSLRAFALSVHTPSKSSRLTPLGPCSSVLFSNRPILTTLKIAIAPLCTCPRTHKHTSNPPYLFVFFTPIFFSVSYITSNMLYNLPVCYTLCLFSPSLPTC